MSIEKTFAIVLDRIPFRESSSIAALLTRSLGRVSAIAKGVRRSPQQALVLERGLLVEIVLYVKPNRDLHTAGQVSVAAYYPSIRGDLGKLALRDAALELILKSVPAPETQTELFDFAREFLERLEAADAEALPVHELWRFFLGWAQHLGFMLNLRECLRCGSESVAVEGGALAIERGGLLCRACGGGSASGFIPGPVVSFLRADGSPESDRFPEPLPGAVQKRLTRLFADYCRFHLDIRSELKAIGFLESVFF
jgi:DNA repair protein RecO (recombination protein O)